MMAAGVQIERPGYLFLSFLLSQQLGPLRRCWIWTHNSEAASDKRQELASGREAQVKLTGCVSLCVYTSATVGSARYSLHAI